MSQDQAMEEKMLHAVELEAPEESDSALVPQRNNQLGGRAAKTLLAVALVMAVASQSHHLPAHGGRKLARLTKYSASGVTQLAETKTEDDLCKDEPQFIVDKVTHNNLGNKGDATGEEGMVYEGVYKNPDGTTKTVEFHVNVVEGSEFNPAWTDKLGLSGEDSEKFMSINLKQNEEVTMTMKFTEPGKTDAIEIPLLDLSFFDLDKHTHGNAEYVKVKDYTSQLTYEGTELAITEDGHWTTFTASTVGTGEDNPKNPLDLTEQQLQRAFTVEFKPFTEATITLGNQKSEKKTHGRKYDFIGKPALKCAAGVDLSKVNQIDKTIPQCCILKLDFISFGLMCVEAASASWYHFMCDATA